MQEASLAQRFSLSSVLKRPAVPFFMLCCLIAWWISRSNETVYVADGPLTVASAELDFDEAYEQDNFIWRINAFNKTSSSIDVSGFASSCSCAKVVPQAFTLEPGQKQNLTLDLNLSHAFQDHNTRSALFEAQMIPKITGSVSISRGWKVVGRVKKAFLLNPPRLSFTDGEKVKSLSITLLPETQELEPSSAGAVISKLHMAPPVGQSEKTYVLTASLNEVVPPGFFSTTIKLKAVGPFGQVYSISVPVSGFRSAWIETIPREDILGSRPIGTSILRTVILRSPPNTPFSVKAITSDDQEISITEVVKNERYELGFHIAAPGFRSHTVTFQILDMAHQVTTSLPLTITYYGVPK